MLIELFGAGTAFALDAASFVVSAVALLAMAPRARRAARRGAGSVTGDMREGLRYVRSHVWLWATFASAAIAYLLFMGPAEVLLPYIVKNDLHGSAADLGHRLRRRRHRLGRLCRRASASAGCRGATSPSCT